MGMDTFVVQLWVPPDQTSCGTDLRGVVRHVATGVETAFRGDDEVLRLLHVARRPRAGLRGTSERGPMSRPGE